jgi:hypothetical protein
MTRPSPVVLAGILAASLAGAQEMPLRVGTVAVRSLDVFAPEEAERGWIYRAADLLHVTTRPDTIRKFLLFDEGDPYDEALLAQTERNLRALPFLKSARVIPSAPHDGIVDVDVVTQDAWTTEISVNLGSSGGETRWATGLTERNFLGAGKEIGLSYDEGVQRTNRLIEFKDTALFGGYWSTALRYADNSDGGERQVRIDKPFSSPLDRLTVGALWDSRRQEDRFYADGEVASEYGLRHRGLRLAGGTPLEAESLRARRVLAGIHFFRDEFHNLSGRTDAVLPEERDFRYVFVGYEDFVSDYVTLQYVNQDLRFEDFNLGPRFTATVALSPRAFGAPVTSVAVRGSAERGWRLGRSSFARALVAFETRLNGGVQNAILSATGLVVVPHSTVLRQTTVAQIQFQQGWSLDRDVQFFADGDHGLRGYRLYAFEGNRRLVLNVEHRVFSGFEVLQLFSFGGAAFLDTGTAVPAGAPLRFASLKTDAGVGLRIGIARAAHSTILRLDCAYAFDSDPLGKKGWLVSFSSGQAF